MIFELPDIFFGSHKKRKGITTTAGETVRIYKKGRKSLTTSGFFKKSGDIFFGATSQKINTVQKTVFIFFESCATTGMRPTANNSEDEAVANDFPRGCHGRRADRGIFNAVKNERPCGSSPTAP